MFNRIINKLKSANLFYLFWMSVIISEILTIIVVSIMSFIINGKISNDYLITGTVTALIAASFATFAILHFIKNFKKIEKALRESESRFRAIAELSPFPISIMDSNEKYLYISRKFNSVFGYSLKDIPTQREWLKLAFPDKEIRREIISALKIKHKKRNEDTENTRSFSVRCMDGKFREIIFRPTIIEDGKQFVTYEDVTERKCIEAQFVQAQKMESVGRLTGGIAHDFNNLLTLIIGNTELIMMGISPENKIYDKIKEIKNTGERAANLIHQLLSFSRHRVIEPHVISPKDILMEMSKMLHRIIGEKIKFVTVLADSLWHIKMDPVQLDQVLTNLVVNAHDAMPDGGELTIKLSNVSLDDDFVRGHPGSKSGDYVLMIVSDTGTGMDEETMSHIFEPFFTTKNKERGTGLGLATCYGILKQNGGYIRAESKLNHGTTFSVYLPRHQ